MYARFPVIRLLTAALVSFFELLFFLYWEYGKYIGLSLFWISVINKYTGLLYFDLLILPYIFFE
ncbi:hypothetical protein OESDEN_12755 [Oesophagostomum dentatum]|uniref:Uncharacterized protein n=1 Tax=Oesophagostomum dentatum TaxID=61180 RepID=A0A0B1SVB4_OESDE|nr:hypothetical protein OESDEN_12755 [Oesophagostomum dentatum]